MGIGTERREDRALRIACDAGDLEACTYAGWEHQLVGSFQFAARLYRRACDGGNPHGCLRLGGVYARFRRRQTGNARQSCIVKVVTLVIPLLVALLRALQIA